MADQTDERLSADVRERWNRLEKATASVALHAAAAMRGQPLDTLPPDVIMHRTRALHRALDIAERADHDVFIARQALRRWRERIGAPTPVLPTGL